MASAWAEFPSLAAFIAAGILGQTLVARGELEQAEAALDELGDGLRYPGFPNSVIAVARGKLALARGDASGALADFMRAGEEFPYSGWRPGAARAQLLLGEVPAAAELADEELARGAAVWGAARARGSPCVLPASCHGGKRGLGLLEESVEVLQDSPATLERATSLCELGAALRRAKRRVDSRQHLREAVELAHRCGAQPLAERARTELVASGARPRRVALSGAESLTASELRVCQLAADGMSNAEIAQALFVTRRTVETHLGNAYRKLEIASRAELANALRGG